MCSHSKTLFRLDDGRSMNFAVLKSSFDSHIVLTLIQWGGGSVSVVDEPVAGAINLSCKKLPVADHDIFNTAFIYACCLSNRLIDLSDFRFGRSQAGKDSESVCLESEQSTLESETLVSLPTVKESSQDMLRTWLNGLSGGADLSHGNKERSHQEVENDTSSCLSSATTHAPDYDFEQLEIDDSEILPEDSASAMPCYSMYISSRNSHVLVANEGVDSTVLDKIESQVNKWLRDDSPDQ